MLYYLLLFAAVFFGSLSYIFVKFSTAPSMALVLYRMFFASVLLLPAAYKKRASYRSLPRKAFFVCIFAGVTLGIHFSLYFQSLKMTQVGIAAVLLNAQVLFVAVFSYLFLKEKISMRCWILLLIALGACTAVIGAGGFAGNSSFAGNLVALASGAAMAGYTVLSRVGRRYLETVEYTFLTYTTAGVTVLLALLATRTPFFGYGARNFATAFGMTIFCTYLGHSIFSYCVKHIRPAVVAAVQLLDTIYGALIGAFLFSETLGVPTLISGAVLFISVVLFTFSMDKTKE